MPPAWLQSISAIYVPLSIASAILVIADIFQLGRRQNVRIMEAAWPLATNWLTVPFLVRLRAGA
jgi:hypothetical protein